MEILLRYISIPEICKIDQVTVVLNRKKGDLLI